ncbi:MAG TPA: AzlD domain-containing protein [Candidatus Limnocylindrales bacterium]|jgi:branched-subunit amino acid transport protein
MKADLITLALLMAAVTYPSRAIPLLLPGIERLPQRALEYLRLVGPAVLASLAAVNVMITLDTSRRATFHVGVEWLAVAICVGLVIWRRSLLLGLVASVALVAAMRATGIAALP